MKTEWIDVKDKLPEIGGEYNVVWDLKDGQEFVVTTMDYDSITKKFTDRETKSDCTEDVYFWQELPSLPPIRPFRNTMPIIK